MKTNDTDILTVEIMNESLGETPVKRARRDTSPYPNQDKTQPAPPGFLATVSWGTPFGATKRALVQMEYKGKGRVLSL